MLVTFEPDACCGKAIIKASRDGQLEGKEQWQHSKCGMMWSPEYAFLDTGEPHTKHWMPRPVIAVFRSR